ncbi:MAG: hypothetical protein AABY16_01910 [Nanoarchaeota archaeon]
MPNFFYFFARWVNAKSLYIISLVLGIFVFLLLFLNYNHTDGGGDLAEYLNNPLRVIHGELPYRDFWLVFAPGEVMIPALIYKMFGLNVNLLLLFSIIISTLVFLGAFFVLRNILQNNLFAILGALLVFFNGAAYHNSPLQLTIYLLYIFMAIFTFEIYLTKGLKIFIFISGLLLGAGIFFKIFLTGSATAALFLCIIFKRYKETKLIKPTIADSFVFLTGVFISAFVLYLPLIDIWLDIFREAIVDSIKHGTSLNTPYFTSVKSYGNLFLNSISGLANQFSILRILECLYVTLGLINAALYYLLPFIIVPFAAYYLKKSNNSYENTLILLFLFWFLFSLPKALGRSDISHLSHAVTPLLFIQVILSVRYLAEKKRSLLKKMFIALSVFTLLIGVVLFGAGATKDFVRETYPVKSNYGLLYFDIKNESENVQSVISYIANKTSEEDYIFVTPTFAPPFYALTNRKNPTYYDSLFDVVSRPSLGKQNNICKDLIDKNTKLIIHQPSWGFDNLPGRQFLNSAPELNKCIEDNFYLVDKYGRYWIYENKEE